MKKILTITAVLLLALTLLWGCSNNTDPEQANVPLFFNLDKGAELTADANGIYTVNFATDNEKKPFKVTDKALLDELQLLDFVGLTLEGDTVTGLTRMPDMPYARLARSFYVQSVGGKTVKMNTLSSFMGREVILELPEGLPIYDITAHAATFGAETTLQKDDCVSIIADESGTPVLAYVISRPSVPHEGKLLCQHCENEVSWLDWVSTDTLPSNAGHYILTNDVVMSGTANVGKGQICLDLNGKTVTQTSFGTRIYNHASGGILSIMDSVGGGTFYPASTDQNAAHARWGMIIFVNNYDSVLNLYSGTLDASNITARYGCAVSQKEGTFNMYGGTILGGTAYGQGSSAISANGNFNMYGGKIVGGKNEDSGFIPESPPGGGAIRVLGYTTIYCGTIEGGESYGGGGVIRVCAGSNGFPGVLTLKGGTITGGKAPRGSGIFVTPFGGIVLSGNVNITGNEGDNLYLADGAKIQIGDEGLGEDARIGISMEKPGEFIKDAPDGFDASKYFTSDDSAKKVSGVNLK